mgnify:CR=1 FL=1
MIKTIGNAIPHDAIQLLNHRDKTPSLLPKARNVEIPDTITVIKPDKKNPNKIGAYFAGIFMVYFQKAA